MAATNLIAINVYQINQQVPRDITSTVNAKNTPMYFPTQGILVQEVGLSATNPLSNGVYVYASIQYNNNLYYTGLHASSVQTLANA